MSRETWAAESAPRDPREHPYVGDVLRRHGDGIELQVIKVEHGWVEYQWWTPSGRSHLNRWTIRGWREVVAKDADLLTRAKALEDET